MSEKHPERRRICPAGARVLAAALAALAALAAAQPGALARSERELSYPFERAWPTAVRFLRIDEGFSIVERDNETGYLVFELKQDGRTFSGSLEVVRTEDDEGRKAVRVVLRIADRPSYVERGILERLARKLRADHGDPEPAPEPPEEAAPPGKDGADGGKETEKKDRDKGDKGDKGDRGDKAEKAPPAKEKSE